MKSKFIVKPKAWYVRTGRIYLIKYDDMGSVVNEEYVGSMKYYSVALLIVDILNKIHNLKI